jgi:hypothetical protein
MRALLQEFAGIDPKTGQKTKVSFPEKCQKIGTLDQNYIWPGNLAALPSGNTNRSSQSKPQVQPRKKLFGLF